MTHNTCARRHTLATYDIFSFAQRNGNPALLLTPQRCGSSFTKKIINNLKPHERNHLTWLVWNEQSHHPGTNLDTVTMMRRLYVPQHHWSYKVNRSATWFDPTIKINMVYRSPTARYVSGLHFLNGSWQDSFSQPIMQWALNDDVTSKDERQDFIHKLRILMVLKIKNKLKYCLMKILKLILNIAVFVTLQCHNNQHFQSKNEFLLKKISSNANKVTQVT